MKHENAWIKAKLLAGRTVSFSPNAIEYLSCIDVANHHRDAFVFIRLNSTSRVRLVASESPAFIIDVDCGNIVIRDAGDNQTIVSGVEVEKAVIHAPEQLFLGLYEYCKIGCKFCPLGNRSIMDAKTLIHYSLDSIYEDIDNARNKCYTSIGITTAIPYHLSSDDVADEMVFAVKKIREKVGNDMPIGVSTRIPTLERLRQLHEAGACEVRLNIEVPSDALAEKLMPHKPKNDILESLRYAVDVFGKGKVSSNIIIGLGETDSEILSMINQLASIGVIATLYPYDPIESASELKYGFARPDADRIYSLAIEHKRILEENGLDPNQLLTMCPACAASHLMPGKDL